MFYLFTVYLFSVLKISWFYRPQYLSTVSVFSSQNPRHSTPESPESRASQIWFFVTNFCLAVPTTAAPPWPPPPRAAPECVTWCFPADFYVVPKRPWNYLRYGTFPFWAQLIFLICSKPEERSPGFHHSHILSRLCLDLLSWHCILLDDWGVIHQ